MRIIASLFIISILLSYSTGCYYDNLDEIHPAAGLFTVCDTNRTISYNDDIHPIMINRCGANNSCHQDDQTLSGYGLGNYTDLIITINDASFMEAITHDPTLSQSKWMPNDCDGCKLDDCSIQTIEAWINQGHLDN